MKNKIKIMYKSNTFEIFKKTPKLSMKWSSYFQVYDQILKPYKNKKVKFVEVGVSNGGSLFIWKKYFAKNSIIIGVDLNPDAKKLEKYGFKIFIGNQADKNFWYHFYKKVGKIDILLDDGGHKNIQQISTVHYSLPYINKTGMIIVEDTHSSYIKKQFGNPSKYSFINYCNLITKSIHRRCSIFNKKMNIYSKKIFSINIFESIVVFNIDEKKCFISNSITNNKKYEFTDDFRNNEYFTGVKKLISNKFNFLNKVTFIRKIIRKIFYKNLFFKIYENFKLRNIFKIIIK